MGSDFGVCVNPEFMREGTAVADFLEPTMTIIGAADKAHSAIVRELYAWAQGRMFETSFRSAEMVKYVCNAWHAVKVAFANEIGTLARELEVDAESLMEIFASDTKLNISPTYLKPGFAFGGSCLRKDVRALNYRAKELDLKLLKANLQEVLRDAEVVVIGTRALDRDLLQKSIRRDQEVIDLVNLEKAHRLRTAAVYKGICW